MEKLIQKKCLPCTKGASALKKEELKPLHKELGESWNLIEEHHLEKMFIFRNFKEALAFVNVIGKVAEEEGHHPNLELSWGEVGVKIWTHALKGLSESDFILAAKIDALYISKSGHL